MLMAFIPPCIPPEPIAAGEHLKVGARGDLLYEIEEGIGLG
jgi:hypothetical protein